MIENQIDMKSMITNELADAISNTAQPRLRNDGNTKNQKKNELCLNITMSSLRVRTRPRGGVTLLCFRPAFIA